MFFGNGCRAFRVPGLTMAPGVRYDPLRWI